MRFILAVIALVLLAAGCGGGSGVINPGPGPGPSAINIAGLWQASYHLALGAQTISDSTEPMVLVPTSQPTAFLAIESDGASEGTISETNNTFTWLYSENESVGTGVYTLALNLTGALTANAITGQGTATVHLISGIDSDGLDGLTLNVTITANRQGPTPTGTAPNLTGDWLIQAQLINPPPGYEDPIAGQMTRTLSSPGVYSIDGGGSVVVVGTTWYLLLENDSPDYPGYTERVLLSGTVASNSFSGAGTFTEVADDDDYLNLEGLQIQMSFQAAKIS